MPQVCSVGGELERAERNPDLRVPAVSVTCVRDVPDAVPVRVVLAPFVRHLRIPLRARRIGRELVAVALVVEGVEDDAEAVAAVGVEVLLQVVDDDAAGIVVAGEHAEIERVVVVEDAHLGVEGRRLAFARVVLDEVLAPSAPRPRASSSPPSSVIGPVARVAGNRRVWRAVV